MHSAVMQGILIIDLVLNDQVRQQVRVGVPCRFYNFEKVGIQNLLDIQSRSYLRWIDRQLQIVTVVHILLLTRTMHNDDLFQRSDVVSSHSGNYQNVNVLLTE